MRRTDQRELTNNIKIIYLKATLIKHDFACFSPDKSLFSIWNVMNDEGFI